MHIVKIIYRKGRDFMSRKPLMSNDVLLSDGILAERLRCLRQKQNLTQKELALILSKRSPDGSVSPLTISAYETSQRVPGVVLLDILADLYNVSIDYLLGRKEYSEKQKESSSQQRGFQIRKSEYPKYDKCPVWVESKNGLFKSRWGLLDYVGKNIVFTDCICKLSDMMKLYSIANPVIAKDPKRYLSYSQMMQKKSVGVESLSPDEYIKGQYEGIYTHSPEKTYLIGIGTGLALPYAGFGISYKVYSV